MMSPEAREKPPILIVDDEPFVRQLLGDMLSENYHCTLAGSAEEALDALRSDVFAVVISDINLGGMTGVEMIPHVHAIAPDTVIMMISGNLTLESPIGALREGAFDYIKKPFDTDYVFAAVGRAVAHHRLLVEKRRYDEELEQLVEERTAQLNFLTYHDAQTSLPNRTLVEDRLGQLIAGRREGTRNAVMLIAIDRLTIVRDTLGVAASNALVAESAARIKDLIAQSETLGRLEPDVFAILLPDTSPEQCLDNGGQILEALERPFGHSGNQLFVHARIGVSLDPDDGHDPALLMKNAASALAHAREGSGNRCEFYSEEISKIATDRLSMEYDLRRAIDNDELAVHYQPKVSFDTGEIIGMEALVRWKHPVRGFVPPDVFIRIAEDIGIIDRIGEWVLRTACEQARSWREQGFDLELAVNLSGRQLQAKDCSAKIVSVLEASRYDPDLLNLEITETALMQDIALSIQEVMKLREHGVKVSMDDFGTGYSSLNAFKRIPLDVLKIDRSFVEEMVERPTDAALIKTIIDLAHLFSVKVVAEGIETNEQLAILNELGCDEWQGYLRAKPLPADEFQKLLRNTRD